MIKRALLVIATVTLCLFIFSSHASAQVGTTNPANNAAPSNLETPCDLNGGSFFGIPHWYEYMKGVSDPFGKCVPKVNLDASTCNGDGTCGFSQLLPIGLAVIDILLRIAGMVAVGFLIYAGFQYVTSQGEPNTTTEAKDGIINAMVGLAIAIMASVLVAFIGNRLK